MFEAFIVTLREGVEAALVVGIIVAFLRREGYDRHLGAVWAGLAAAVGASLAGAFVLYRWAVNQEVFEGLLYLGSAVIVGSMMVWMWRHSHELSGEMKGSLSRIVARERQGAVAAWLFAFTFLMVFREGILVFSQPGALPAKALEQVITAVRELDMDEVRAKVAAATAKSA